MSPSSLPENNKNNGLQLLYQLHSSTEFTKFGTDELRRDNFVINFQKKKETSAHLGYDKIPKRKSYSEYMDQKTV